jgi:hypothetical protein
MLADFIIQDSFCGIGSLACLACLLHFKDSDSEICNFYMIHTPSKIIAHWVLNPTVMFQLLASGISMAPYSIVLKCHATS